MASKVYTTTRISEAELRKAVRDLHAHGDNLRARQFRTSLEEILHIPLVDYKDIIRDELDQIKNGSLNMSPFVGRFDAKRDEADTGTGSTTHSPQSPSKYTISAENYTVPPQNPRKPVRRGSTLRTLAIGIQEAFNDKKYVISHHDHHYKQSFCNCLRSKSSFLFQIIALIESLQAFALLNYAWPTNLSFVNGSRTIALTSGYNVSDVKVTSTMGEILAMPTGVSGVWRLLARILSLDAIFNRAAASVTIPFAISLTFILCLYPSMVIVRWRRQCSRRRKIRRQANDFNSEIEEGFREHTVTKGSDIRKKKQRMMLEKRIKKDLAIHEAERNRNLIFSSICTRLIVVLSVSIFYIPGTILAARLLQCSMGQPGMINCVGTPLAPSQTFYMTMFIVVLIPLVLSPFASFISVQHGAPRIPMNDLLFGSKAGTLREYSEEKYDDILYHDSHQLLNPFRVLYLSQRKAFKQERSVTSAVKLVLVLYVFSPFTSYTGRNLALILTFLFATMGIILSLGIHHNASIDQINISTGTIATFLSSLMMVSVEGASSWTHAIFHQISGIAFSVYVVLVLGIIFHAGDCKRHCCGQELLFENVTTCQVGIASDIITTWEPMAELNARVWKPFWNKLIEASYGGRVAKYFELLRLRASNVDAYANHFKTNPDIEELREYTIKHIEGVDAYYVPDDFDEKELSRYTKTGFGRLDVQQFPFSWRITYDDSGIVYEGPIGDKYLRRLVKQNKSKVVKLRRQNRLILRALASNEGIVRFKYREGRKEELDGVFVDVDLEFSVGHLKIATADGTRYSHGFKVSLEYDDGQGFVIAPGKQGEVVKIENRKITIGLEDMGISHLFDVLDRDHLQDDQGNDLPSIIDTGQPLVRNTAGSNFYDEEDLDSLRFSVEQFNQTWRDDLHQQRIREEQMFPSSFFFHIYNAPLVERETLEAYFSSLETASTGNEGTLQLANLPRRHASGLDILYSRMKHLQRHPSSAVWFFFWNDVWECNCHLISMRRIRRIIDPKYPDSLCYTLLKRPELEAKLKRHGMLKSERTKGFFRKDVLDTLYKVVHQYKEWREMIHTHTTKQNANALHVVEMRTTKERKGHNILEPILQRRRKRIAAQSGNTTTVLRYGNMKRRSIDHHMLMSLASLTTLTVGAMTIGVVCILPGNESCGSLDFTDSILLLILSPLCLAATAFIIFRWAKKIKMRSLGKKKDDISVQVNGIGPESDALTILSEAQDYLQKGRALEKRRENSWEKDASKVYCAARKRLEILPLEDVHEDVCFAFDREAACTALRAHAEKEAKNDLFLEAMKLYIQVGNIWHTLKSHTHVGQEAPHHFALAFHKAFLCALASNDSWVATEILDAAKALDESSFVNSVQYKRMRDTLCLYISLEVEKFAGATQEWGQSWHLSQWMSQMHIACLGAMKQSRKIFLEATEPDHDAQAENSKYVVNILIAGPKGAGSTSMCLRWMYSSFVPDSNKMARGKSSFVRTVEIEDLAGARVRVHLHDMVTIAGMKEFRNKAHGVLIVYNSQSESSFAAAKPWLQLKLKMLGTFALIGAQADTSNVSSIASERALELAKSYSSDYFECSSKTGVGVDIAFKKVITRAVHGLMSFT